MKNNEKLSKSEFISLYLNLDEEGKSIVKEMLSNPTISEELKQKADNYIQRKRNE